MSGRERGAVLVQLAYDALAAVLREVDSDASWTPTACTGWAVRDLVHHCVADAQRALVALHTPTPDATDRDAVTYWADWTADPAGAAAGRRHHRVVASLFGDWDQLRELHASTAAAVVHAALAADPADRVRTQGHVLTVDDLLRTLCVEASIHHIDLVSGLDLVPRFGLAGPPGPAAAGLAEARHVVDALLAPGSDLPPSAGWTDERVVLVGTGRADPTAVEAAALGPLADRLPVFC